MIWGYHYFWKHPHHEMFLGFLGWVAPQLSPSTMATMAIQLNSTEGPFFPSSLHIKVGSKCFLKSQQDGDVCLWRWTPKFSLVFYLEPKNTADGRNPPPVDMVNIPLFTRFYTSQVVQDFFHQQYHHAKWFILAGKPTKKSGLGCLLQLTFMAALGQTKLQRHTSSSQNDVLHTHLSKNKIWSHHCRPVFDGWPLFPQKKHGWQNATVDINPLVPSSPQKALVLHLPNLNFALPRTWFFGSVTGICCLVYWHLAWCPTYFLR